MKIPKLIGAALLALASLAFAPRGATAATTTYADGDLFLGFRAAGETQDYLINLGQPGSLTAGALADVGGQLATTFGNGWYNRTDLFFSIIGGNSGGAGSDRGTPFTPRAAFPLRGLNWGTAPQRARPR